jgi:hypothetical protein
MVSLTLMMSPATSPPVTAPFISIVVSLNP